MSRDTPQSIDDDPIGYFRASVRRGERMVEITGSEIQDAITDLRNLWASTIDLAEAGTAEGFAEIVETATNRSDEEIAAYAIATAAWPRSADLLPFAGGTTARYEVPLADGQGFVFYADPHDAIADPRVEGAVVKISGTPPERETVGYVASGPGLTRTYRFDVDEEVSVEIELTD